MDFISGINIKYTQFESICRFCLKRDHVLKPIFHEDEGKLGDFATGYDGNESVVEMIQTCTELKLSPDDKLPKLLCLNCSSDLFKCSRFRWQCRKSNEILENSLRMHEMQLEINEDSFDVFLDKNLKERLIEISQIETPLCENEQELREIGRKRTAVIFTSENQDREMHCAVNMNEREKCHGFVVKNKLNLKLLRKSTKATKLMIKKRKICEENKQNAKKSRKSCSEENVKGITKESTESTTHEEMKKEYHNNGKKQRNENNTCNTFGNQNEPVEYKRLVVRDEMNLKILRNGEKVTKILSENGRKLAKGKRNGKKNRKSSEEVDKKFIYEEVGKRKAEESLEIGNKLQQCQICGKMMGSLYYHMLKHKGGTKRFKCSYCDKAFFSIPSVKKHELVHKDVRSFKCNYCDRSFKYVESLRVHHIHHTKELNYECKICGEKFKYPTTLSYHKKRHNQDRRYKCLECGQSFITKTCLKKHEIAHTDEKPYKCEVCGKKFKLPGIRAHRKIHHHQDASYKCNQCGNEFKYKLSLKTHLQRIHHLSNDVINANFVSITTI